MLTHSARTAARIARPVESQGAAPSSEEQMREAGSYNAATNEWEAYGRLGITDILDFKLSG